MGIASFFRHKLKRNKKLLLVSLHEDLKKLEKELSKSKVIGIDTEFDWRTTYFPKLSIIQISTLKKKIIIDCLKVNPKKILKTFLENSEYLKIFHSVRSDSLVISKSLGIKTANVFDIQIAEKILTNRDILAYSKIVKKYYGIKLNKSETNSNWLKRPLSENQLKYAQEDVDFLIGIYRAQKPLLRKNNLEDKVKKLSEREASLGNESLKKLRLQKNEKKLSHRGKKIFLWREETAEEENIPPGYIFKDKFLKKLSEIAHEDPLARKKIISMIGNTKTAEKFIMDLL